MSRLQPFRRMRFRAARPLSLGPSPRNRLREFGAGTSGARPSPGMSRGVEAAQKSGAALVKTREIHEVPQGFLPETMQLFLRRPGKGSSRQTLGTF